MMTTRKKSVLLLGAFALATGLSTLATPSANAATANLPSQEVWIYYYSSASMDTSIGFEFVTSCFGVVGAEVGETSNHYVMSSVPCEGSGTGGEVGCYIDGVLSTCPADICESGLFNC